MKTLWREINGFDGYEVSSDGQVRSLDRVITRRDGRTRIAKGTVLKHIPKSKDDPRPTVRLWKKNRSKTVCVHTLVAQAFIGPRPENLEVRHIDGNSHNNNVQNLSYGTSSENHDDMVRHGTHYQVQKKSCPVGHKLESPNLVAADRDRGQRNCLACSRGRANAKYRGTDKLTESNRHYAMIMGDQNG